MPAVDLRFARRLAVLGAGTAGLFAALELRRLFGPAADITVIDSANTRIIGVGEGGILNFPQMLARLAIDENDFIEATGAVVKLGFAYTGWRDPSIDDTFYHMFYSSAPRAGETAPASDAALSRPGHVAAMIANAVPVFKACANDELIAGRLGQAEVRHAIAQAPGKHAYSFHFGAHKVADYLARIARQRDIRFVSRDVSELARDPDRGTVSHIRFADGDAPLPVDFLIDASGFARISARAFQSRWRSFSDHLLLDRAIPFNMPHPDRNPALATRALAMKAGWMWQIPVRERVGAGYVFSSRHLSEDEALREIETTLGFAAEPARTLRFEPGYYDRVWQHNVLAIGLASGFVEPLEATSIGIMLNSLMNFSRVVDTCAALVPATAIDHFNRIHGENWREVRDFLFLHYDSPRRDTAFWRDMAGVTPPESYAALRPVWASRIPLPGDVAPYAPGHTLTFDWPSWTMVAQGMGVVTPISAAADMARLPAEERRGALSLLAQLRQHARPAPAPSMAARPQALSPQIAELIDRGIVFLDQGDPQSARACFVQATGASPGVWQGWVNLGRLQRIEGQFDRADDSLSRAVALAPDQEAGWREYGIFLHQTGRWLDAERALAQALQVAPASVPAQLAYAELLIEMDRRPEGEQRMRQAIALSPEAIDLRRHVAAMQLRAGWHAAAAAGYQDILERTALQPDARDWYHLGLALTGLSDTAAAEAAYRQALTRDPALAEAHVNLANLLAGRGGVHPLETEQHYLAALAIRPAMPQAREGLAKIRAAPVSAPSS